MPDIFDERASKVKQDDIFDQRSKKMAERKENPHSFFNREARVPGGLIGAVARNPGQALAEAGSQFVEGLESLAGGVMPAPLGLGTPEQQGLPTFSELLRQKSGVADLPEKEREEIEAFGILANILTPLLGEAAVSKIKAPSVPKIKGVPKLAPGEPPPRADLFPESGSTFSTDMKALGKDIKEKVLGPNISEKIPASISPERFKNTTQAGKHLEKAVEIPYKKISAQEKKAYDLSAKANAAIEAVHPELVNDLRSSVEELKKIPDPSAPLKRYIESSEKMLGQLADISPDGTVNGYKPISNQVLIKQIQEYNQIPKYDFPTDTKTGIFKTLIDKLTKAVDTTAAKHPEANKAWKEAKEIHAHKSDLFADNDVAKWIKLQDKNYSKDFISSIDIDKIRKLEPVLSQSSEGKTILQQMKRDIVEQKLEEFFTIGKRFDKKQIAREISELEPILTEEEIEAVEKLFEESQTPGAKITSLIPRALKAIKRPSSMLHEAGKIK